LKRVLRAILREARIAFIFAYVLFWASNSTRMVGMGVAGICALLLILLQNTSFFVSTEWFVFDHWTKLAAPWRPLDPSLALVVIDEGSMTDFSKEKGWEWPWPRESHADMIAYLKRAGAREIWIDIFFDTPRDAYQDDEVRATAAAAGNVHFAARSGRVPLFTPTFPVDLGSQNEVLRYDLSGEHLLAWPLPFNELKNDKLTVTPVFSLVIEGEKILKALAADDRTDPVKIQAVLAQGPMPPGAGRFRDKIVYIGGSAAGTYDLKPTPSGLHEPAVMIHLVNRSNELTRGFFREIGFWTRSLVCAGCCFLIAFVVTELPSFRRQLAATVLVLAVVILVSFKLFVARIWVHPALDGFAIALTFTSAVSVNYLREGRKRQRTEDLFGKFLSRKMVDRLISKSDEIVLGGEKAELTVFFSDLSGFTSLSETMPSDRLVGLLNAYLGNMSELICEQEGTLDKYIGDAIMAFWGAPDHSPDHAWQACYAALACRKRLGELAPVWEAEYGSKLSARIGINTDEMTVGLIGSRRLHNYTVIGDAVNLASRLEGANKAYGTSIMISQRTLDLARGKIEVRPIDFLRVKGKTQPVRVYELLARAGELADTDKEAQAAFTSAFEAYQRQDWTQAEESLRQVLALQSRDPLAAVYLKRIAAFKSQPPGPDWDGVFTLDEK
jgi:adenylate cyclase